MNSEDEITALGRFETETEAYDYMINDFKDATGCTDDDIVRIKAEQEDADDTELDMIVYDNKARASCCGVNDAYVNWQIIDLDSVK